MKTGDIGAFRQGWKQRTETKRYHFRRGRPQHQVEFAFQNHWRVFRTILGSVQSGIALEVGAGRGSMAAFFADAGFEAHLLDTSITALVSGRDNFDRDGLHAHYVIGDALRLPYPDNSVDVIVSIGLMEHFESIGEPCAEQIRVLRPGGVLLNYVVPERPLSVQTLAIPINALLRVIAGVNLRLQGRQRSAPPPKPTLYRNSYSSKDYLRVYRELGVSDCGAYGTFPAPIVSHSPSFPFSPMRPWAEQVLIALWRGLLGIYGAVSGHDPWMCSEYWGLAFVAWAKK